MFKLCFFGGRGTAHTSQTYQKHNIVFHNLKAKFYLDASTFKIEAFD